MATAAGRQLNQPRCFTSHVTRPLPYFQCNARQFSVSRHNNNSSYKLTVEYLHGTKNTFIVKATSADTIWSNEDGVSLGTMKLPSDIDIARFESLLFQWANSLCQGAYLPLPMPLKVDKINGGARLAFIMIDDGKTEVLAFIDCFVTPATDSSGPIFRAIRNGPRKDQSPPGEERIMKGLLDALRRSVEIARV